MTESEQIVYISCVEEVRYSFVSHLSEALRLKGIHDVLVDSDDLLSKESQSKVERARVSVMVLPFNHKVNLDKLVKVLECQKNKDQVVVPVLYGVRSLDLEWLSALNSKGFSSVHYSRNEGPDSELVEEITRDVYGKLFYMERIGIYSKLQEIENMVWKQPFGVRCVGIWGMPGIGKTTLAKAVFDQMSGDFDAYCFIEDFDKVIHEKGLYRLLEEHFLKEKPGAGSTITKLSLLSNKLKNKRVLVVLDDVLNPLIAEPLLGGFDWFGPESLIIITSRDKQVFRLCGINQIYEVQGLNEKEALQLFLMSASIKNDREPNLHKLSMKVIEYANGNPLALSIYGTAFEGKKNLSEMETTFLELKGRPPLEIVEAFKSSYDSLNDREKNIFLDIACFFQGENVDYVMQLLGGCGFLPHVGINVLVEKCLVTISENRVWMHNLIQVVGQEIIKTETEQIERRSRLWEPGSIKYLLEDNKHIGNVEPRTTSKHAQGTEEIEGMFLDTSNLSFDIKPAAFDNMLNLRLLKIYCSNPESHPVISFPDGYIRSLPNELRLLHWENYPLQVLPKNFDPMHLVEINMPYSQLQTLWGKPKNLKMLRTIRLCHSQKLVDVGDLSKAQDLEVIDLQGCTRLRSFPATDKLLHLRVVNLSGCTEIKEFPEVRPNIEALHLQGTAIRKLIIFEPNGGELVSLSELKGLSNASKLELLERLEKSRSSSQDLAKLICLELKDCTRLKSLPNMVNLELLKVLDLSGCWELETIQGFPPNLKELSIAGTAVREVPQLPQSLELFNAHGCVSLKSIHLDSEKLPMHYTFSNCFDLSPQVILVEVLANAEHIPRERRQELNKSPAFSFCAPSHANQYSTLDLQPGSSVVTQLNPSWRNTLVGFAMLVEVAFSEDYCDATGFGISCICRWSNKEGRSHRIKKNLHCWALGKAVQKDHMFVFFDVNMRPSTDEGNDPDIWADLVVFEFFPVDKQTKPLSDSCTVRRCGVRVVTDANCNTSIEDILPVWSLDSMEVSGNEGEEALRISYDGLQEMDKALFLYMAGLFNDEDVGLVAPHIANIIDMDVSYGIKVLASRSLIRVSSNGEIVMPCLQRQMGKEILHTESKKIERLGDNSMANTMKIEYTRMSSHSGEEVVESSKKSIRGSLNQRYMLPDSSRKTERTINATKVEITENPENQTMDTSHVPTISWRYDVYPSFCGKDVRVTFLSHFLKELDRKLIIAFKDSEIERSRSLDPELKQAIRDSKIAVVVFSKNYASSSWCLDELVEIVKCKEEFGQLVIPVFYGLDPSHVRKQTGDFGRIFEKTCHNQTEEVKSQWQKALTDVANILGFHSVQWGNEADMVEKIANDVLGKLLTALENNCFEDYAGMEDHIAKMSVLLELESKEVKMVGIWGSSGIGKTTIARVLFNRLRPRFQGSIFIDMAFISKIKESYGKANIKLHLQRKFLSEILGQRDLKIDNLGAIKERLRNRKVLICIDDLDDAMVLDALAGQTQWFGSGSRIIVNTTNKHLLEAHKIHCIYEVALPSEELALKIFCQSTFRKYSPPEGFEELAVEAVRHAGYLPLGLKVTGSSLRGRDKEYWEMMLFRFHNDIDGKIENVLRISYDALPKDEQVIFRHIACLFNLEKVDDIKLLLADSVKNVELCLRNLVTKAMLHLRSDIVEMPPLLQQMGKAVGRQQFNPGKQEFLVNSKDICDVLENNTGTKKVIGISLNIDEIDELHIHENTFKAMVNLRFLKFFSNRYKPEKRVRLHLPDSFDHLPPKLKLLYWDGYPMKRMPSNFQPEHLVKLKMENSNLRMLWQGSRKLTCLKEINLWGSENLKEIPDLSMATNLEKLYVGHCLSWVALPSSIRKFNKLTELGMLECRNLDTLPTDINLESPKCLSLTGVKGERLQQGMQPLIRMVTTLPDSLRVLLLTDIPNMVELPFSIKNLKKLTDLRITRCTNLVTLPTGINLESLERLNLNGCSRLRTFPDISRNISSLYLEETAIEVVPRWIENFSKLKYLVMQRCSKLEYVHLNISKLKHLEWVNFSYCGALAGADLTGYPNGLSVEEEDAGTKLPVLEEASSSHQDNVVPKVDFSFINCFNLDQEALFQQLSVQKLVLSGKELPLYFTHQTTGTSLAISLLEDPLSPPFFRFRVCAVVVFNSKPTFGAIGVSMKVTCRFKGKLGNHFDYPFQQEYFSLYQKGSHLFLLDCCMPIKEDDALLAELNYDQVDIQCHMSSGNSKFKLKEWGIRLSRDCSSPENRLDN